MAKYFILSDKIEEEYCGIYDLPDDLPDIEMPAEGTKMGKAYPSGQRFRMAKEVPGIVVPDVINNALNYLMVSGRLKKILEENVTANIEFLPFTLLNHKGRPVRGEYHIANIIGAIDCVDMKRTEGRVGAVHKGRFVILKRLFLLEDKIDSKVNIFRISSMPKVLIVRDDLKKIMEDHAVTGVDFLDMGSELDIQ